MALSEMEETLKKFDHRLRATEQILPTLATKADLREAIAPLATKAELREAIAPLATKAELRDAVTELRTDLADTKRHTDMRFEDVRDDIAKVAEAVASLAVKVDDIVSTLRPMRDQLATHDAALKVLLKRRRS